MRREVKVGSISWIDADPNPVWTSAQAGTLDPDWIPKTYIGLAATKNDAPPKTLSDFKTYQAGKDFRALTYCHCFIDIDDTTGKVNDFRVLDAVHDGGWTPFFKLRRWPLTGLSLDGDILFNWKPSPGEASPLSLVNTLARHKHSALAGQGSGETVLVNALIKFRAGSHTNSIGINNVKAPFHVPWVWCETLLTFAGGKLKLYGQGSVFPSHAWYLDDAQVATVAQVGDSSFPLSWTQIICLNPTLQVVPDPMCMEVPSTPSIVVSSLKIYPTLSAGVWAKPGESQQPPLADETSRTGPVPTHLAAVAGGKQVTAP